MINHLTKRNTLHISCVIPIFLVAILTGCEQKKPGGAGVAEDMTETPQTGVAAIIPLDCEEFACAEIASLYAVHVKVEEHLGIGLDKGHKFKHELEVNGTILAEEILVEPNVADYVFDADYNLKSLDSVESFIIEHRHLPGIPSAREMESTGSKLEIGESYRMLLEKIEELTLYSIEQEKRIEKLERMLAERKSPR
jgi:hypothetical protein